MTKFLCADLHLQHPALTRENADGKRHRPFLSMGEHDEAIVQNWNSVVSPTDKVYVAGDVVWHKRALPTLGRLNGKKHLVKGNHDILPIGEYLNYFYEVSAYRVFQEHGFLLSHMPVHPRELNRFNFNVHGHLHDEVVTRSLTDWDDLTCDMPDPRYMCISMEQINYTPIPIESVLDVMKKRGFEKEVDA